MSDRPVQYFSDEYLARCAAMSPEQICEFLDGFRQLAQGRPARRRLISLRVEEPLLAAFKHKARTSGVRYQTQIQRLMKAWIMDPEP